MVVPALSTWKKPERYQTTAIEEAVSTGGFRMVLTMGVRKNDDIVHLLRWAAIRMDPAVVLHLFARNGWRVNDQPGGGSSMLDRCLLMQGDGERFHSLVFAQRVEDAWEVAKALVERGALWKPSPSEMRSIRFYMRFGSRGRCVEMAQLLLGGGAANRETVAKLFGTPMIRRWMGAAMEKIEAILSGSREAT